MKTVRIDRETDAWELYTDSCSWKGYIYAEDLFDEVFVIYGNSRLNEVKSASWYLKSLEYLEENEKEENERNIMEALKKLFPDDTFGTMEIHGCVQGEWQSVIYKANAMDDYHDLKQTLEDFYFGHVTLIYADDDDYYAAYVSDSELWDHEHKGDLKEFIIDLLYLDSDEEIQILESDGYTQTKKWKEMVL